MNGKKIVTAICLLLLGFAIGFFVGKSNVQEKIDSGSVSGDKNIEQNDDSEDVGLTDGGKGDGGADTEIGELQDEEIAQDAENASEDNDEVSDEKDKYELPEF